MTNNKFHKVLDSASYILLVAAAVIMPLFVDKNLANFYIIPKQYVFIGLVSLAFLFYAAKVVIAKQFEYRRSVFDLPLFGFLVIALITAIFSVNTYDSFLGRNEFFVINFLFLFFLFLYYILSVNYLTTVARWRGLASAIIGVGGLTALVFILKMVFKWDLFALIAPGIWNSVDKLNSQFGLWLIVIFSLAAGHLLKKELSVGKSLLYFLVMILSFASLVLLSFNLLWWILLAALVLLLLVGVSFVKEIRVGWISVLFVGLILTVVFLAFGTPKSLQSAVPSEVALGFKSSWSVAYHSIVSGIKPFIIGSGVGTFGYDFSKFRSADFNYDSAAWTLRFNQPYNTLLAILAEGGVVLCLIFLFIFVFALGHIFQMWYKKARSGVLSATPFGGDDVGLEILLVAITWVVLSGGMTMMFFGSVLWWLWFALLALTVTGLAFLNDHVIKANVWEVEDTPQYSLAFSFTLIVVIAAVVMVGVWGAKLYYADVLYARALQSNDLSVAEQKITAAINQRGNSDIYNSALAQVYLMQASAEAQKAKPNAQKVSALVANAVNAAKSATDISPASVGIWENLATMYENAAVLVPGARDWALKSWGTAKDLEPTNPVLWWRLGNNYGLSGKWDDAIKNYEEAVKLKQDYVLAYVGLANAYENKQDLNKAVEAYKTIMPAAYTNPDALFNFGRLLYNRNKTTDRADAEKMWLEAIRIQPNYSNALYSLGLMYENRGDKNTALQYYYKVKDLNPDNADILKKISSIVGAPISTSPTNKK